MFRADAPVSAEPRLGRCVCRHSRTRPAVNRTRGRVMSAEFFQNAADTLSERMVEAFEDGECVE